MKKRVTKTIEGFIRKLKEERHPKYASELRYIIAMSRKRNNAFFTLSNTTITLLEHIIKFITMPKSRDKVKWNNKIKCCLSGFDIRNINSKEQPWLSIAYIQADLNDVLSSPNFLSYMEGKLIDYPEKDTKATLSLIKKNKTLKSLGIKLFYDSNNNLNTSINGQTL